MSRKLFTSEKLLIFNSLITPIITVLLLVWGIVLLYQIKSTTEQAEYNAQHAYIRSLDCHYEVAPIVNDIRRVVRQK